MGSVEGGMRIDRWNVSQNLIRDIGRFFGAAILLLSIVSGAVAQALLPNPTPEIYVNHNGNGAEVVPNGQLSFDGQPFTCGKFPTVLDPLLNDYAAAPYKGFILLNPKLMPKVSTPVKLWI